MIKQTEIKFPAEVARVALELGLDLRDCYGGADSANFWAGEKFRGISPPYTLASDEPLTSEQAEALGEAWPGSVWTDGKTLHRYVDGVWELRHPDGRGESSKWTAAECGLPTYWPSLPGWHLVSGPEEEAAPQPQGATLLDCMNWCAVQKTNARVTRIAPFAHRGRTDFPLEIQRLRSSVSVFSDDWRYGVSLEGMTATDWLLSTDEGKTWFNPNDQPQPKIEPRTGAELRRWLVRNPGRKIHTQPGEKGCWWDATRCDYYTEDGPAVIDDDMSGVPVDGGW